jgi:hypothetical protein
MRTFQRLGRWIRPSVALPLLAALGLVGFVMLAHGCGPDRNAPMPPPAINPRLPDVPVPFGFKFDVERSYDRLVGSTRVAEHLYTGDATIQQVAAFYRLHMNTYGWTVKEENLSGGRQRFTFEKGADNCYISIWDDWGTKVLIKVMAKGTKPVEPPAKMPPTRPASK